MQHRLLLNKMQDNRTIACGFVKISKEALTDFWKSLTEELNSAGPPIKNVTEWKKVWIDQKRYVRSKAAANLKNQRATGGGPNQTKHLSADEQFVYDLVGMKESVEGLENALKFVLPEPIGEQIITFGVCEAETTAASYDDEAVTADVVDILDEPCRSQEATSAPPDPKVSLKRKGPEQQEKLTSTELITKEVAVQENLCSIRNDLGNSIKNHNKEMEASNKRIYIALEKSNELKAKKLKMMEQHQSVLEQLRFKEVESKIEKNKKLIQIEEIKLKIA